MGYYINPVGMKKEDWLRLYAVGVHLIPPKTHRDEADNIAVCLVDNGIFTAAGVAYSQDELESFAREDGRKKVWCMVPLAALREVMPTIDKVLET